jgi:hypothetical protein
VQFRYTFSMKSKLLTAVKKFTIYATNEEVVNKFSILPKFKITVNNIAIDGYYPTNAIHLPNRHVK